MLARGTLAVLNGLKYGSAQSFRFNQIVVMKFRTLIEVYSVDNHK